jgi:GxxExxY protein
MDRVLFVSEAGMKDAVSTCMSAQEINAITKEIIGAAIDVHRRLGRGLLESAYQACLQFELLRRGFLAETEVPQPINYDGLLIETGYRIDLLVQNAAIVEVKAVDRLLPIHRAQILTYHKLSERPVGLLLNFNEKILKDGIERWVHGFPD